MTKIITKPEYAPARQLIDEHWRRVKYRIKLVQGKGDIDKQELCVMQATNYIFGDDPESHFSPCTSKSITNLMIDLNDFSNNAKRRKFKSLIPEIVNTAPTKMFMLRIHTGMDRSTPKFVFKTINNDPDYIEAEAIRKNMIEDKFFELKRKQNDIYYYYSKQQFAFALIRQPTEEIISFITELADVAKFDSVPI